MKLATVEDFEKAFKELRNPRSKPFQYAIKTFGYCTYCKKVTQYEGSYDRQRCAEICTACHNSFGDFLCGNTKEGYITDIADPRLSENAKKEIEKLRSRAAQRKFFSETLEASLAKRKTEQRVAKKDIQRLAACRMAK